jgi:low affinity Fe/Cu permease
VVLHDRHRPHLDSNNPSDKSPDCRDQRPLASRFLHLLGELSASSTAGLLAAVISAGFLLAALAAPRATPWLTAFEALAAAVTLVMVFALQHTQARQQVALQRKLDEILRVLPGADAGLLHVESASPAQLQQLDDQHVQARHDALSEHEARQASG